MTGAVRHEKNERFPETKTTTGVGADARGTCTQCGSLSTCMMISCPASSRPRSRPPMPEKSDTVFMPRAEDGGARGGVVRCRGVVVLLFRHRARDNSRIFHASALRDGPSETSGSEREGPTMDETGTEAAR